MVNQVGWVPESQYRRAVGLLRGWVTGLAILGVVGVLILGALMFRWVFQVAPFPVVVSSPAACHLGGDPKDPRLYVAVDVQRIVDGALVDASSLGPSGWTVEAAGVAASVPEFAALEDEALTRIVERAAADSSMLSAKRPTGVLLAVLDTQGESSGSLAGLRIEWVSGEPVYQQDVPLGIEFTPSGCTVTTVR